MMVFKSAFNRTLRDVEGSPICGIVKPTFLCVTVQLSLYFTLCHYVSLWIFFHFLILEVQNVITLSHHISLCVTVIFSRPGPPYYDEPSAEYQERHVQHQVYLYYSPSPSQSPFPASAPDPAPFPISSPYSCSCSFLSKRTMKGLKTIR